jgi:putative flippase GtrA
MLNREVVKQLTRYGIVGVSYNLAGYLLYLLITWLGVDPKVVVGVLYPIGALISFFANKGWSFSYSGPIGSGMLRFVIAHFFGYFLNLGLLFLFVDIQGYPHELVQLVAIFAVALSLFLAFRYFVFPERHRAPSP